MQEALDSACKIRVISPRRGMAIETAEAIVEFIIASPLHCAVQLRLCEKAYRRAPMKTIDAFDNSMIADS